MIKIHVTDLWTTSRFAVQEVMPLLVVMFGVAVISQSYTEDGGLSVPRHEGDPSRRQGKKCPGTSRSYIVLHSTHSTQQNN